MPIRLSLSGGDYARIGYWIRTNKLDPRPRPDFTSMEYYWHECQDFKRVIETYAWGVVVRGTKKKTDERFTALLIGRFEPGTGLLISESPDGPVSENLCDSVPWYAELAEASVATANTAAPAPDCLGYHEKDVICDGGRNPNNEIEVPCAWRRRCIAVQHACDDRGVQPIDWLGEPGTVQRENSLGAKVDEAVNHKTPPSLKAPVDDVLIVEARNTRPPKRHRKPPQWAFTVMAMMVNAIRERWGLTSSPGTVGELYLVESSKYHTVRIMKRKGRHGKAIAQIWFRPKIRCIHVAIAFSAEELAKRGFDTACGPIREDTQLIGVVRFIRSAAQVERVLTLVAERIDAERIAIKQSIERAKRRERWRRKKKRLREKALAPRKPYRRRVRMSNLDLSDDW